jgi:hypothetical protein
MSFGESLVCAGWILVNRDVGLECEHRNDYEDSPKSNNSSNVGLSMKERILSCVDCCFDIEKLTLN